MTERLKAWDINAKSSRKRLLASALACVDEFGFADTTIETIRKRADSSIGSLYHHFGNKQNLFAILYFELLDAQLAWTQTDLETVETAEALVEVLIRGYMDWVSKHPQEARVMYTLHREINTGTHADTLKEKNKQRYGRLQSLLTAGVEAGVVRALPREIYASLLFGSAENYCRAWLADRVRTTPCEYAGAFAEAAWRAIKV